MYEAHEQLREVESHGEWALERHVDRDEGVRFVDRDEKVLRAGIAVRHRLRQLIETVQHAGHPAGQLQQISAEPVAAPGNHPWGPAIVHESATTATPVAPSRRSSGAA